MATACALSWNKGIKAEMPVDDEQQIEDAQNKLMMRYYHLDQAGPFVTVGQPLLTRKLVFIRFKSCTLRGNISEGMVCQQEVLLMEFHSLIS